MRIQKLFTAVVSACVVLSSCIQDEPLNIEAAIDGCSGTDIQMVEISNSELTVSLYVQQGADLSEQAVEFTLSDGATIAPDESLSGDGDGIYDFSDYTRTFTVTSESQTVTAQYTITIVLIEIPTEYHFEYLVDNTDEYDTFYEENIVDGTLQMLQWSSGNKGFALTKMADDRTGYPTVQVDDGYVGKCVKLETKDTGSFGAMVKMYLAAGNLFIGNFDLANALSDPLAATRFGYQFFKVPVRLTGYYKYKKGDVYTDLGEINTSMVDTFNIYAVFYEATDSSFMLDGEDTLLQPELVMYAEIDQDEALETDTWTKFDIPFQTVEGKSVDEDMLEAGQYKMGIVFASSINGDLFSGSVGSTLYIDEVTLECEED